MRSFGAGAVLVVMVTFLVYAQAAPVTTGFMHAIHATNSVEKTAE